MTALARRPRDHAARLQPGSATATRTQKERACPAGRILAPVLRHGGAPGYGERHRKPEHAGFDGSRGQPGADRCWRKSLSPRWAGGRPDTRNTAPAESPGATRKKRARGKDAEPTVTLQALPPRDASARNAAPSQMVDRPFCAEARKRKKPACAGFFRSGCVRSLSSPDGAGRRESRSAHRKAPVPHRPRDATSAAGCAAAVQVRPPPHGHVPTCG